MKIEVCETCGTRDGQLLACTKCKHFFHVQCVHGNAEVIPAKEAFLCSTCDPSLEPACCLCRKGDSELLCCNMKNCNLRYHRDCLKGFHTACSKQEKLYSQFNCPAHYCHTCVAEVGELHPPEKKLIRCIQCPTSYHAGTSLTQFIAKALNCYFLKGERCLAAGSVMLSLSQMRCFKHAESRTTSTAKKSKKDKKSLPTHYNVNWCMVCSEGGTLICCERCPAAFHTRCVGLEKEPDGSYLCPECTTGKTVLHGDIVWIKMSVYRFVTCQSSACKNFTYFHISTGGGQAECIQLRKYLRNIERINPTSVNSSFTFTEAEIALMSIAVRSSTIKMR